MRYSLRGRSAGAPRPRGGPGVRGLLGALVGALLLTGCSTGTDAVDVNNGGEFPFGPGTPAGEVIPPEQGDARPELSGNQLGGREFQSSEAHGGGAGRSEKHKAEFQARPYHGC